MYLFSVSYPYIYIFFPYILIYVCFLLFVFIINNKIKNLNFYLFNIEYKSKTGNL